MADNTADLVAKALMTSTPVVGAGLTALGGAMQALRPREAKLSPTFSPPMTAAQREAPMVDEDRNDPHGPHDLAAPVPADHGKFSK